MGIPTKRQRPYVAIVNSWSEMNPGHYHLKELAAAVKRGILMAGGLPLEFNTVNICDSFAVEKRFVLPFRDLIAFTIEMMLRANDIRGAYSTTYDKNVPAHIMAAARVNIPSIVVTGGPMLPGRFEGKDVVCCTDGRPMIGPLHGWGNDGRRISDLRPHQPRQRAAPAA